MPLTEAFRMRRAHCRCSEKEIAVVVAMPRDIEKARRLLHDPSTEPSRCHGGRNENKDAFLCFSKQQPQQQQQHQQRTFIIIINNNIVVVFANNNTRDCRTVAVVLSINRQKVQYKSLLGSPTATQHNTTKSVCHVPLLPAANRPCTK